MKGGRIMSVKREKPNPDKQEPKLTADERRYL